MKFTLEQSMTPRREVKVYFHSFFNLGAKWELVAKAKPWTLSRERDPVRIVQEAGWDP